MGRLVFLIIFLISCIISSAQVVTVEVALGTADRQPSSFHPVSKIDFTKRFPFWVKVTVISPTEQHAVLKSGNWYMQTVSLYNEGTFIGQGNHFTVHLVKGSTTFYLHYPFKDDKDKNGVTVTVDNVLHFTEELTTMKIWQHVFASLIGLLFLISTAYSFIIRSKDKIYSHYALYLFTILVFFTYQYGILGTAIPVVNNIPPAFFWIFSDFITITYLYFSQSFLNMRKSYPVLYRLFDFGKYLVYGMLILETISYFIGIDLLHSIWFKGPIFIFEIIAFPTIFYRIYKQKTTLSWLFLVSTIILGFANLAGQFSSTFKVVHLTNYFIQGGLLIDAFLFSVGIGIRFGISNREKSNIQKDLIRQLKINEKVQEQNASKLESMVKERTMALNKRNHENELLIKEIHHRVKNNLQIVSSLLHLSERKIGNETAQQAFRESANRINSMGLIHSLLYQHEDYSNIDLKAYITELSQMLLHSFHSIYPKARLQPDVTVASIDMNRAIEIGLIINELMTNSLKHGIYPDECPHITIGIHQKESTLHLSVIDNGHTQKTPVETEASFGMRLVESLARKWNGSVAINRDSGFAVLITLSLN